MKKFRIYYKSEMKYYKNIEAKNLQEAEVLFINWINAKYTVPIRYEIVKIEEKIENKIYTVKGE